MEITKTNIIINVNNRGMGKDRIEPPFQSSQIYSTKIEGELPIIQPHLWKMHTLYLYLPNQAQIHKIIFIFSRP